MRNGRERSVWNGKERGGPGRIAGREGAGRDGTGTESGVRDGTGEEREGTGPGGKLRNPDSLSRLPGKVRNPDSLSSLPGKVRLRTVSPILPGKVRFRRNPSGQSIQAPR